VILDGIAVLGDEIPFLIVTGKEIIKIVEDLQLYLVNGFRFFLLSFNGEVVPSAPPL
jgi:hypothetical protein